MGNGHNFASVLDQEKKKKEAAAKQAAKAKAPAAETSSMQGSVGNQEVSRLLRDRVEGEGKEGDAKKKEGEEPENSFTIKSGFDRKSGKPPKNKYSFELEAEVPFARLKAGKWSFLNPLKLTAEGSSESEQPISLGAVEIQSLEAKGALDLAKGTLEESLGSITKRKVEGGVSGTGSVKQGFGADPKTGGEAGAEAKVSESLTISPKTSIGDFKLSVSMDFKAWAKQSFGDESKSSFGIENKTGAKVGFTSKPLTRGSVLKDPRFLAETDASVTTGLDSEKGLTQKIHVGAEVGFEADAPGKKKVFIKFQFGRDDTWTPKERESGLSATGAVGVKF